MWENPQLGLISLLAACTLANVAAAVLLARASLPMRLRATIEAVEATLDTMRREVAGMKGEAELWTSTMEGLIDRHDDAFERAEKKRASAAATASRSAKTPAAPNLDEMTRGQRIDFWRARTSG